MTDKLTPELLARLAEPFRPDQVRWKPQVVTDSGRALAVAYVDPRVVSERLDTVVGGDWSFHWEPLGIQQDRLVIKSSLTILGVTREDVGEHVLSEREQADPWKSAVSDALKRAAVHFGVARYLYWLDAVWCAYDRRRREFIEEPYIDDDGKVRVRRKGGPERRAERGGRAIEDEPSAVREAGRPRRSGPRRVSEASPAGPESVGWEAEFYSWAARYMEHRGVEAATPRDVHQWLGEQGHMAADLQAYDALSDAQAALIKGLPAFIERAGGTEERDAEA